jgi:ATP-dependent Lhr-like helicase
VWERDVLPRRLGAYSSTWLDELTTSGEVVWVGAGALARTGRVALYFREDVHLAGPPPSNAKLDRPEGEVHDKIRERLAVAPSFWLDLVAELGAEPEELHAALWDLAWTGEVTNDAFAPLRARSLRAVTASSRRTTRRFSSRRGVANQAVQGRWSLTETLFRGAPPAGPRMRAQAELMLERYGVVTREVVLSEGVPGGFSSLYPELSNLEILGTARRGYFVEGLGGAQFALAGAVERMRALPRAEGEFIVLAATDPAQPYGAALAWPKRSEGRRPARTPGAFVLLRDGNPVLYVERGGKGLVRLVELEGDDLIAAISELSAAAREATIPKLAIERVDGEPVIGSGFEEQILAAGFSRQPRRLVASA